MFHQLVFSAMTTSQSQSPMEDGLARLRAGLARDLNVETRRRLDTLPEELERIAACVARNSALLQNDVRLPSFQAISEIHDETVNLAAASTTAIAAAVQALGAIERTLIYTSAQQAMLRQHRAEQRPWKRKRVDTQLAAIDAFHARLQGEHGSLSQRRDQLMADILLLMEQGAGLRLALRRHFDSIAVRWQQQRQEWLQLATDNWERALRGLPLRPLEPFTGQAVTQRLTGVVLWYDPVQRRGQVKAMDGGAVVHIHRSSLRNIAVLHPGQRVGFGVRVIDGTPWADEVILIR